MPTYRAKLYRGKFYAVWTGDDGQTRRQSLRTTDREEAERRLVDFRRDLAAPVGSTVGDYVQAYLDYKDGRIRDHVRLAGAWANARDTFGPLRPDQITPELCEEYADHRRAMGRSDGTILKEINVIRQALNWSKVNTARFEAPSAPPPRDRHLTKAEARRLLEGARQPHIRLFILIALLTGARRGAILDLTWDRVDFEKGKIYLHVPGEENRKRRALSVPLGAQLRAELEAAHDAHQTPYVIEYAGDRVLNVKRGFAAAVARAGLVDVTPHDLRHTAAVWMAEDGVPFEEIAQYLGHSSTKVTFSVYARFSPTHLQRASKSLEF
jgi:integrase